MVFSSIIFLFYFLPVAVTVHSIVPKNFRNTWLLTCSLVFYTWGVGAFVLVMIASILVNYGLGRWAAAARRQGRPDHLKWAVISAVVLNVGLLAVFKYAGFAFAQLNSILTVLGAPALPHLDILLPIGVSFFTFQSMSYVFDVSRGDAPAQRDPLAFALYIALFPQLVAGPIVRYAGIASALTQRRVTVEGLSEGLQRFAWGLIKKVVIADALAPIAEAGFAPGAAQELGALAAWTALLAYTLQIYFDFSGYSDMAIGLGRALGFRFPENFDRPYSAASVTEFWRRWHMTLSNWFRDYVYIPLGGRRCAPLIVQRNLWIVFLLTGLWHGAAWTFIAWGAYHGSLLVLERATGGRMHTGQWRPAFRALTLLLVMLGWVLFRAHSIEDALAFYGALIRFDELALSTPLQMALDHRALLTLGLASLVVLLPTRLSGWRLLNAPGRAAQAGRAVVLGGGTAYALILTVAGSFTAFLYFQF